MPTTVSTIGSIGRNASNSAARSFLYVPGDRSAMLAKALESDADVVVADLEDAVPEDRRELGLANVLAVLSDAPPKPLHVRIPPVDGGGEVLLQALATSGVTRIRLAKVGDADDVRRAAAVLSQTHAPATLTLHCLIESAIGVERAFEIASADHRVAAISLGEADLRADLGVVDERGLAYARSRTVVAARAARLAAPVQSVYTDTHDVDGLRASCAEGRALGFHGRSVIHPRQIPVVNDAFELSPEERELALLVVEGAERVARDGAFLLTDGRLIDPATLAQARVLLEERND